jgi:hypothetical protein
MKLNFSIEINEAELFAALCDTDFEEFRVKLLKVSREYHNSIARADDNITNTLKGKPAKTTDFKICAYCNNKFKPSSNVQKYCMPQCKHNAIASKQQSTPQVAPQPEAPVNYYQTKLREQAAAKKEAEEIQQFREHPKLDLSKKPTKYMSD